MAKLFKNRKAALQLSINAIVVLILAITILGLGLGFIKGQFGALEKQFAGVSSEIKSELINKIRNSGELLVFNQVELEAILVEHTQDWDSLLLSPLRIAR